MKPRRRLTVKVIQFVSPVEDPAVTNVEAHDRQGKASDDLHPDSRKEVRRPSPTHSILIRLCKSFFLEPGLKLEIELKTPVTGSMSANACLRQPALASGLLVNR
jgi:hypothetical protein